MSFNSQIFFSNFNVFFFAVANYSFIVDGTADKRIDDFIEDKEKTFEDYTKVNDFKKNWFFILNQLINIS